MARVMSEDVELKVGDVVVLKSGGHKMTVASTDGSSVTCDWSVRGDIKSKCFAVAQLTTDIPEAPLTLEQLIAGSEAISAGSDST